MVKIAAVFILMILSASQVFAQYRIELNLELNESQYKMLVSNIEARGISADELAKWLVDNGRLSVKAEKMNESSGKLLMYVLGESGLVGKYSYRTMMSSRPASLSMMMSSRQLAGDLGSYFPGDHFFPSDQFFQGDHFFSGDHFIPGDTFMRSDREIEQMAIEAGRKALSSIRSTGGNSLAIILFAVPEKVEPDDQISTVPVVVAGHVK